MRINHLLFIVFLCLSCASVSAQNKEVLYDFAEIPQALLINPGIQTSKQWSVGVPLLSSISLHAGSNAVTVQDIFANDGVDINDKVRDKVIYNMSITDEISGNYQMDLINVGFRTKNRPDDFYSFGMYLEGDAIGYYFKDLALLAFEGNGGANIGRRFDLSHFNTRGELTNVFHVGLNRKVNEKLTLGIRAKLYSNIFSFTSTNNDGYFITTEGENNILANTLVADLELKSSGLQSLEEAESSEVPSILAKRALLGGNLGAGVDVGFTYKLNERTIITGSLLDVGFIRHSNDVKNYVLQGSATVEGVEVFLPQDLGNTDDLWENLVDEIETLLPFEEEATAYTTLRPIKLYSSIKYSFGNGTVGSGKNCGCLYTNTGGGSELDYYPNSIGAQLYAISRPRGPQMALTAFYERRFANTLALKATYTVDKFSFSNVGLGMNLNLGKLNMYAMADNLLSYSNLADSHYASFQLGLNIISW